MHKIPFVHNRGILTKQQLLDDMPYFESLAKSDIPKTEKAVEPVAIPQENLAQEQVYAGPSNVYYSAELDLTILTETMETFDFEIVISRIIASAFSSRFNNIAVRYGDNVMVNPQQQTYEDLCIAKNLNKKSTAPAGSLLIHLATFHDLAGVYEIPVEDNVTVTLTYPKIELKVNELDGISKRNISKLGMTIPYHILDDLETVKVLDEIKRAASFVI